MSKCSFLSLASFRPGVPCAAQVTNTHGGIDDSDIGRRRGDPTDDGREHARQTFFSNSVDTSCDRTGAGVRTPIFSDMEIIPNQ